jgi:hypothetical protein
MLMKINDIVKELYPQTEITRIRSDSIEYDKKIDLKSINDRLTGFSIKEESMNEPREINSLLRNSFEWPDKKKIKKLKADENINPFIEKKESFLFDDFAGVGKSYWVKHKLMPLLKEKGYTYMITSSTKKNAEHWETKPIQHYLKKDDKSIRNKFQKYDYIIIDEASQLNMSIIYILEILKRNIKINFILVGDSNQCKSVDDVCYLVEDVVHRLCDYNILYRGYHDKIRYTKRYYDFLSKLLSMKDSSIRKLRIFVKRHIRETNKLSELNLCYTHRIKNKIINKGYKAYTIHSYQGKTIDCNYSIYIYNINDYRILYTALSRSKGFDFVALLKRRLF